MDRRSVGELSDTIGSIYDCAFDPALWPSTLAMLRRHMNFANASLDVLALPAGTVLLNVVSGVDEAWVRRTPEYGSDAIEQWGGAEKMRGFPLDEPIVMSVVSPAGLTRANRYYLLITIRDGATKAAQYMVDELPVAVLTDSGNRRAGGCPRTRSM